MLFGIFYMSYNTHCWWAFFTICGSANKMKMYCSLRPMTSEICEIIFQSCVEIGEIWTLTWDHKTRPRTKTKPNSWSWSYFAQWKIPHPVKLVIRPDISGSMPFLFWATLYSTSKLTLGINALSFAIMQ